MNFVSYQKMKILENLRIKLNRNAELSGQEKNTNKIINKFLERTNPDIHIRNIGGYGIIAVYKGKNDGRNIMLRADIDGLNIPMDSQLTKCERQKANYQFSHRCGHDGHAAILCGVALKLGKNRPEKGNVILVFQAAEETGEGAEAIINDALFHDFKIDLAFALHNIPGFAKHQVIIRKNCFAAASQGLKLIFNGKTSHASQADKGNNPQKILPTLLDAFQRKYENMKNDKYHTTLTVTYVVLGEETFGVTPGHAEIWMTLRSYDNDCLNRLTNSTIGLCEYIAKEYKFKFSYSIHEAFAATINSGKNVEIVEKSAQELKLSVNNVKEPFPWSEDFGRFGDICPTCLFGLGCGLDHEPLHSPYYDFEDDIIDTGVNIFEKIINNSHI